MRAKRRKAKYRQDRDDKDDFASGLVWAIGPGAWEASDDRISFRKFLDFPSEVPKYTMVRYFRERLAKISKDKRSDLSYKDSLN
jgi:hypothetical protein